MKKITVLLGLLCVGMLILLFIQVVNADTSSSMPQLEPVSEQTTFRLETYIAPGTENIYETFPYRQYLDSANIRSIGAIKNDLQLLDSLTHQPGSNRQTLSHALTEIRGRQMAPQLTGYHPDALLSLIQWAEPFYYYAQLDPVNDLFYQSIYTYWLSFVTDKLAESSRQQSSLRNDFRFQYLVARCNEKKFSTAVKIPSYQKVLENVLYSNYGHLINATWNQSSWLLKAGLLFIGLVFITGMGTIVSFIIKFIKKQNMKYAAIIFLLLAAPALVNAQGKYDPKNVEIKTLVIGSEPYGIIKMPRKGNRVKVKYFASKNYNGTSVADRYRSWSVGKNIVTYSSGTYMNSCIASQAQPVGLCIDQGVIVSENPTPDNLDGLMIVYATGGMAATNLDEGNLSITFGDGTKQIVDIRHNAYDLATFKKWAKEQEATVFQTHLFVYKDKLLVKDGANPTRQERRFLAVCKLDNGDIVHYIINMPTASDIFNGGKKALSYLKDHEEVNEVIFMINLDTGCQDVFTLYNADGQEHTSRHFQGGDRIDLRNASNILVYYYE